MVSVNERSRRLVRAPSTTSSKALRILVVGAIIVLSLFGYAIWDGSKHAATEQNADASLNRQSSSKLLRAEAKGATEKGDDNSDKVVIGYAVSVTGCGSDPITEGAAVLKHSVHLAHQGGKYGYKFYAIVHPDAMECGSTVKDLGYEILTRPTPVAVQDIKGDFLRTHIESNGCCGEKELIKLEAYTLTQHPIVVHMDLDTVVLKSMDALFDAMLGTGSTDTIPLMWPNEPKPKEADAYFTRDYNMANPSTEYKPVQGGYLVLKPSLDAYKEFVAVVTEGDFRQHGGWLGKVGPFYGSMTFQGLIPLFYDYLHPGTAVELNRCVVNQMCDNPRTGRTVNDVVSGDCRTGEKECEDCRSRKLGEVVTAHFTLCQKPWHCLAQDSDVIQQRLCRKLHHEWYRIRSDLEKSWGRSGHGDGGYQKEQFFGYCAHQGHQGYGPIAKPYGSASANKQR